jgi:hypothetical protein
MKKTTTKNLRAGLKLTHIDEVELHRSIARAIADALRRGVPGVILDGKAAAENDLTRVTLLNARRAAELRGDPNRVAVAALGARGRQGRGLVGVTRHGEHSAPVSCRASPGRSAPRSAP